MATIDHVGTFDLDITLRDAGTDERISPTRRMIANAAIGVAPEDAYYATRELREAIDWVHACEPDGKKRLAGILATPCDDFQRCLYFCLAGRGVVRMLEDLDWLESLTLARAQTAVRLFRRMAPIVPLVNPYVAECPDGPLVDASAEFTEGPSWFLDADLTS